MNCTPERADLHLSVLFVYFCRSLCNLYLRVLTTVNLSVLANFAPDRADWHLGVLVTHLTQIIMQFCTKEC